MRYPIYIFLLMSGVFYLTGNPFLDETSQTGEPGVQGKLAKLKYGRRINAPLSVDKKPETTIIADDAKMTETANSYTVAASDESTSVADTKVQEPAPVTLSTTASTPSSKSFTKGQAKRFKDPARKAIDWTVFGNKRKNVALTVPVRPRSQDEIDAEGIAGEPKQVRSYDPLELATKDRKYKPTLASESRKYKRAEIRRQKLKARKAARKARKTKRLARLKRRTKGAYRIARKAKKKTPEKEEVASKPRRKEFGFTQVGVQSRLNF